MAAEGIRTKRACQEKPAKSHTLAFFIHKRNQADEISRITPKRIVNTSEISQRIE